MKPAVYCRGLAKSYGEGSARVAALRGLDLEVQAGELLMLVGPSGCGDGEKGEEIHECEGARAANRRENPDRPSGETGKEEARIILKLFMEMNV